MIDVSVEHLPKQLVPIAKGAQYLGWVIRATAADGPPSTIVLRFARDDARCYGAWTVELGTVKWRGGASRRGVGHKTLRSLKQELGLS